MEDLVSRQAFFEYARRFTSHLSVDVDDLVFLVQTNDVKVGGSLFIRRRRVEMSRLATSIWHIERKGRTVRGATFVDVGANIGTTALPALTRHGCVRVLALEPAPDNARLLRANAVINGLDDRVDVIVAAASKSAGIRTMRLNPANSGAHRIVGPDDRIPARKAIEVTTLRLDDLVDSGRLDPVSVGLLWLDVEGHEGDVLAGASSLTTRRVPTVVEFRPRALGEEGLAQVKAAFAGYGRIVDLGTKASRAAPVEVELERLFREYTREVGGKTDLLALPA